MTTGITLTFSFVDAKKLYQDFADYWLRLFK